MNADQIEQHQAQCWKQKKGQKAFFTMEDMKIMKKSIYLR